MGCLIIDSEGDVEEFLRRLDEALDVSDGTMSYDVLVPSPVIGDTLKTGVAILYHRRAKAGSVVNDNNKITINLQVGAASEDECF